MCFIISNFKKSKIMSALKSISPIDGRYFSKTNELSDYFSEYALIKYRVFVEIKYFIALKYMGLPELEQLSESDMQSILMIYTSFNINDAEKVKGIEKVTNHDVKAVEYFIKEKMKGIGLSKYLEFVHFGLTSQDINNTAFPLMINDALNDVLLPQLDNIVETLIERAMKWKDIPMLAYTHGQPASPTTMGKELFVFVERLENQINILREAQIKVKFGGATGNFNAHKVVYPEYDWRDFGNEFCSEYLGLTRLQFTTQIAHYDSLAVVFDTLSRIDTILFDFARDVWSYISMEYFKQKVVANEVGSSAMPHKVNPIDFENAEGNLGMANAVFRFLSSKLPVSRLQRDLTDSTVIRNVGVPFAHMLIALKSLNKGIGKLILNEEKLKEDLDNNWAVVSEAIQNVLRKIAYPEPYETLKKLTRGNSQITKESLHSFIDSLDISEEIKIYMKEITPFNYVGYTLE